MAAIQQSSVGTVMACSARLASASQGRSTEVLKVLDQLTAVKMTVGMLKTTHVAKIVNRDALLRHESPDVRRRSALLLASWRHLIRSSRKGAAAAPSGAPAAAPAAAPATPPAAKRSGAAPEDTPAAKRMAGALGSLAASAPSVASTPPSKCVACSADSAAKVRQPRAGGGGGGAEFAFPTSRRVSLSQTLAQSVPQASSGRRGGGGLGGTTKFFCFKNAKSGRCDRPGCPYPHFSS